MRLPDLQRLIFYHARAHAAAVETADATRRRIESLVAERAVLERAEPTRRNERRLVLIKRQIKQLKGCLSADRQYVEERRASLNTLRNKLKGLTTPSLLGKRKS